MKFLTDKIGSSIDDDKYGDNLSLFHDVSISLSDKIAHRMDARQVEALMVAKKIRKDDFDEKEWLEKIDLFGDLIKNNSDKMSRLIWCSLNMNTGFSAFSADYLASIAHDCGLDPNSIYDSIASFVPEMR